MLPDTNQEPAFPKAEARTELSEREQEILKLVATGASNKQIAQQLVISPNTVKVHLRNIFAKIGVATRTEAALYAIKTGLLGASSNLALTELPESASIFSGDSTASEALTATSPALAAQAVDGQAARNRSRAFLYLGALGFLVAVTLATAAGLNYRANRAASVATIVPTQTVARWQALAAMPTARSGLAVAAYENTIYAISGETQAGVTPIVEVYDIASNKWAPKASKPTAVADVSAAVIGGQIYVPGGRLGTGPNTNILETYDPQRNQWHESAHMPVALSAYAMAAFEGHLYVFGGWDGTTFQAKVYEYDPSRDQWSERTSMPTARGFAGATVANGKVYVIGGKVADHALSVNEEYVPENDDNGAQSPWTQRKPLPQPRYSIGVTSIADIVHIIGGKDDVNQLGPLEYFPQRDEWQSFPYPGDISWYGLAVVADGGNLHAIGGFLNGERTGQQLNYQAIYVISLPLNVK